MKKGVDADGYIVNPCSGIQKLYAPLVSCKRERFKGLLYKLIIHFPQNKAILWLKYGHLGR